LLRHVRERRSAAHAVVGDALAATRTRRLVARLAALAASAPGPGARVVCRAAASGLVRPLVRSVRQAGRKVEDEPSTDALHVLRVRVKRLRYALESLDGLGGDAVRTLTRRLAGLQELLGEQRDAVSQQAWLRAEAATFAGEPETLLAVGALCEALRRRAKRLVRQVPAARDRALRHKLVTAVLRELAGRSLARAAA
ncbi:MAG: CHAD domain-containing protein, partial [Candidatus Binatia bacterium]